MEVGEKKQYSNEEILEAFKIVLPYMNKIVREDMAVGLTDLKEYLGYHRAKNFELDLPAGKPIAGIPTIAKCIDSVSLVGSFKVAGSNVLTTLPSLNTEA